ncbi:MAG: DUF3570 domain-containing protein [Bdellovibrionales bacterium]|nr:DUF3570 domain-containing protein [Bdellovibrionales bacterium]
MCKPRNRKKKSPRKYKRKSSKSISVLFAAAAAIPGLSVPDSASAQSVSEQSQLRFQYSYYEDRQGGDDRISVRAPQAWFLTPVGESTELEGSFVLDSISGASSLYHDTLSGASGTGIEDERAAGDVKVTQYFEDFSVGVGASYSKEDDYESLGGSLEGRFWNEKKTTTYSVGVSGTSDDITSSNNALLDESSHTIGGMIGVTQVINKNSIIQSNLTCSFADGYLSDPYKAADNRPDSRDRYAWLTRYVLYVPELEGSFHADYRYYRDSWGVQSHTFDTMWYQPLDEVWMLRPHIRFYSQDKADFYSNTFPPTRISTYSADQRLSGFGELTTGLKLSRDFGDDFSLSLGVDVVQQHGSWKLFSEGSPDIENFSETIVSFGILKKF